MSGLAYYAPESEIDNSGPSSAGGFSPGVHPIRAGSHPNGHPNWTPGNPPHDAGGLADDFYIAPRMSPQLALDMSC